jgi:hypothetical protein
MVCELDVYIEQDKGNFKYSQHIILNIREYKVVSQQNTTLLFRSSQSQIQSSYSFWSHFFSP